MLTNLRKLAEDLAVCLRSAHCRVVLAESCTGGLISATLAQMPGISDYHCGSVVVYRNDTKSQWLNIPAEILEDPGPVSETVAQMMAMEVLALTPEAHWSASISGHLGPNAPDLQDGLVFVGVSQRDSVQPEGIHTIVHQHWLGDPIPVGMSHTDPLRERRIVRAAEIVFQSLIEQMTRGESTPTNQP